MSFAMNLSRIAAVAITAAPLALAHDAPPPPTNEPGDYGRGLGTITLPSVDDLGILVGVLLSSEDGTRYMLDCKLTNWMPAHNILPYIEVSYGGLYGFVREIPVGTIPGATDQSDILERLVQGTWQIDNNSNIGEFQAVAYERRSGFWVVAGSVNGQFRMPSEQGIPAPQTPPFVLASGAGSKGSGGSKSKKSKGVLRDAASNAPAPARPFGNAGTNAPVPTKPFGDVGSNAPAPAKPPFGDAGSKGPSGGSPWSDAKRKASSEQEDERVTCAWQGAYKLFE